MSHGQVTVKLTTGGARVRVNSASGALESILTDLKEDEIIFSDSATSQKLLDLLEPILRCEKLKNVPKIIFNHCSACDDIFLDASANYDLNMFRQILQRSNRLLIG